MHRRDLLKTGALAGLGAVLAPTVGPPDPPAPRPTGRARNVIFYAWDGLTWEDLGTARAFARRHLGRPLAFDRLLAHGAAGSMDPSSLTSAVTDSAAATSAWATGRKIVNGQLSVFPDGTRLETVLRLAQDRGLATGLVTTTRLTHATPAGWFAQVPNRRDEEDIARWLAARPPDVLLGGGHRTLAPEHRADGRDLYAAIARHGHTVVRTAEALESAGTSRLLGVFAEGHLPYAIDRLHQSAEAPTLAAMTAKALEVLSGAERGFLLQVEAGRIDHAHHANDAAAALWELLDADAALDVLLAYVDVHPETLLLVASDHGTGGGVLYGVGERYRAASATLDHVLQRTASFEHLIARMERDPSPEYVAEVVARHTEVTLTPAQADLLARALRGDVAMPDLQAYGRQPFNTLAFCLRGGTDAVPDRLNVSYATGQHTAGPVPVAAYGAGTAALRFGLVDNTDLYGWMTGALGIDHVNPTMSAEEALAALEG